MTKYKTPFRIFATLAVTSAVLGVVLAPALYLFAAWFALGALIIFISSKMEHNSNTVVRARSSTNIEMGARKSIDYSNGVLAMNGTVAPGSASAMGAMALGMHRI